jgi:hypothetical protein
MSRFLPADHSKGDERTIGGYAAVHARPAAFEGRDGFSYSVEILADSSDDSSGGFGAFFLFSWEVDGHLESAFLLTADAIRADRARRVVDVQRRMEAE